MWVLLNRLANKIDAETYTVSPAEMPYYEAWVGSVAGAIFLPGFAEAEISVPAAEYAAAVAA